MDWFLCILQSNQFTVRDELSFNILVDLYGSCLHFLFYGFLSLFHTILLLLPASNTIYICKYREESTAWDQ